jgi:hypothetical protein
VLVSALLFASVMAVPGTSPAASAGASNGCHLEATGGTVELRLGDRVYDLQVPEGLSGPQSHNWPDGADRADIAQRIWDLFERNRLP